MGQRVVDAVVALCDAVAHIGCKIACSLAAVGVDCLYSLLHELIQMGAAGVAVAKGALHHDLGLCKVVHLPAHADLQRIVFRCQFTHCLRTQFHDHTSKMLFFCFANRPLNKASAFFKKPSEESVKRRPARKEHYRHRYEYGRYNAEDNI